MELSLYIYITSISISSVNVLRHRARYELNLLSSDLTAVKVHVSSGDAQPVLFIYIIYRMFGLYAAFSIRHVARFRPYSYTWMEH